MRTRRSRGLRAVFALLLGLVAVELGLRAYGAILVARSGRGSGGGEAVLCLGDSNVFGLYERPEDSYPGALARRLAAGTAPGQATLSVTNLGLPGKTTYDCVLELQEVLASGAPEAVLVTAGFNNHWSWRPLDDVEYGALPWYERLRLVRLGRLMLARVQTASGAESTEGPEAVSVGDGPAHDGEREYVGRANQRAHAKLLADREFETADYLGSVRRDWREMQRLCSAAGVPFALVTYGARRGDYGVVNEAMRAAAEEDGIALFEAERPCLELAQQLGENAVYHPDYHPRRAGYEVIARVAFNGLIELGVLDRERLTDLTGGIEASEGAGTIEMLSEGEGRAGHVTLRVAREVPGTLFQVILWAPHGVGEPAPDIRWPEIVDDALMQQTLGWRTLTATTDADGVAEVHLPLEQLEQAGLRGKRVSFGYIVTASGDVGEGAPPHRYGAEGVGVLR